MGMGEKKERAKQFKQKTAKQLGDTIGQAGLFDQTASETHVIVECVRDPADAPVRKGDHARLIDMKNRIDVYVRMTCIGTVLPGLTDGLRKQFNLEKTTGRSIAGVVIEVSELTPTFLVQL
jgi:hypothetical protein